MHQCWEYFPQYIRDVLLAVGMDQPLVLSSWVGFFFISFACWGELVEGTSFARSLKIRFHLMVTLNLQFQSGGLLFIRGGVGEINLDDT